MGYRRNQKTLRLTFTGELEGLEVTTRRASTAVMRRIVAAAAGASSGTLDEQATRLLDLCDAAGELLDSWNYQDEQGNPLPATAETLANEDAAFVIALAYGWLDGVAEWAEQLRRPVRDEAVEGTLPVEVLG